MGPVGSGGAVQTPSTPPDEAFEYAKALYQNVIEWYKDVHDRARSVVTLDGALVTILSSVIVLKRGDLVEVTKYFGLDTKVGLVIMALSFVLSLGFAMATLAPLWLSERKLRTVFGKLREEDGEPPPMPSVMWYSQFIRQMGRAEFVGLSRQMTTVLHSKALASQVHTLSTRLKNKYRLVFGAFFFAGTGILALLYSTASYVVRAN